MPELISRDTVAESQGGDGLRAWRTIGTVGIGLVAAAVAGAQSLNIDFGTATDPGAGLAPASYGAAAGQVGSWNQVGTGAVANLLGLGGGSSGVSITVTADSPSGSSGGACSGNLGLLVNDNFYSNGPSTVVLSGLANDNYLVYFYDPSHTGVPTGDIDANGVLLASLNESIPSCTLTANVNFVPAWVPVTSGTMTIQLSAPSGGTYTGLAGIQLVQGGVIYQTGVPTLGPWGIALLAALVLAGALIALRRLV
jgi:hypothetical protein